MNNPYSKSFILDMEEHGIDLSKYPIEVVLQAFWVYFTSSLPDNKKEYAIEIFDKLKTNK